MSTLVERDLRVLWHPATHFADLDRLPPIAVTTARGSWLEDENGRRILDAISSWWTCIHGHGHPVIRDAVQRQIDRLDHVLLAGFTHEPAIALAEALIERAPGRFGRVFYADCGSAAVEVALKLSYQYRIQTGEARRHRFAALRNGYHGETLGALAVCGSDAWREPFGALLREPLFLPAENIVDHEHADLVTARGADGGTCREAIELLARHADEVTAVVLEPVIQCAGRMAMPGVGYFRELVQAAQELGIHVIADEIAVAFGRTGRLFATEWTDLSPDLLCLGKGLSGGVLPLACVLIREGFDQAFTGHPSRSFLHSHTFTGNPIACAAGVASLRVFDEEHTLERLPAKIDHMARLRREVAERCRDVVVHHRQAGLVAALQVAPRAGKAMPDRGRMSLALREAALHHGLLLRPLHDTIYWMPPLAIEADELDLIADATAKTIEAVLG